MQLLQRKKGGAGATAEEAQRQVERSLDAAGSATSFKVMSRDDRGRLQYLTSVPAADFSAGSVEETLKDLYGGGRFFVLPLNEGGRKCAEGFEVSVYGESKLKKKQRNSQGESGKRTSGAMDEMKKELEEAKRQIAEMQQQEREEKIVSELRGEIQDLRKSVEESKRPNMLDSVIANVDKVALAFSNLSNRETPAQMMQAMSQVIANLKEVAGPDETERLRKLAEVYSQMAESQAKPPVTTGPMEAAQGWKGGAGEFIGSMMAAFDMYTGGKLSQAMGSGGMPTLRSPAKQQVAQVGAGPPGQPVGSAQGFSGVPTGGAGQQTIDLTKLDLTSLGVDPVGQIRRMLSAREPVDQVAEKIVYLVDFLATFCDPRTPLMQYIIYFVNYPRETLDQYMHLIPELKGAPEKYVQDLTYTIIPSMENYLRQEVERQRQASAAAAEGAGKPEPAAETGEKRPDQGPAQAGAEEGKEE